MIRGRFGLLAARSAPVLFGLAVLSATRFAHAQASTIAAGTRVVIKYEGERALGSGVLDAGRAHHVYTVESVQGTRLGLAGPGIRGWASASEVVPLDRAVAFFSDEIRNNPSSPRPYLQRGLIWSDLGERDLALADYAEAIRLSPSYARAYEVRGFAWLDRNEYDLALADLAEVIRLQPWNARAYLDRGIAWARKGDFDRAIADFNESIRRVPRNPWAFNNRGIARTSKGDLDRAIADFDQSLRLDPQFIGAYLNRAHAWSAKKDYDRAIADDNQAIQLDPNNASLYNNRALCRERQGEYGQAAADFAEALRLDPKFQAARAGLALLLAACPDSRYRDGKRAVALATEAHAAGSPDESFTASALAAAFAESGDFAGAVAWQEKALTLVPASAEPEQRARLEGYKGNKPYRLAPGR